MANKVVLDDRYEINPDAPRDDYDSPAAKAYGVIDSKDSKADLIGFMCPGIIPPRTDILSSMRNQDHNGLTRPLAWGVVFWPPKGQQCYCIVVERPTGRRALPNLNETRSAIPEEVLMRLVFKPMIPVLRALKDIGMVAGHVRPNNLYFTDATNRTLKLGEFYTAPPGYGQPAMFETIERGMADPAGRGPGVHSDDLYCFGVTALVLAMGRNPCQGMTDEQILQTKIERGSFPALAGEERVSLAITEALRGLLMDDPKQRWSVDDLEQWLNGRRQSPKQAKVPRRASRPMEFGGQEYFNRRSLAMGLSRDPANASVIIEDGSLERWLRRSLGDEDTADALRSAIETASAGGQTSSMEDRLMSRASIALDPGAPIRYRGIAVMPDGMNTMLAEHYLNDRDPSRIAQIVLGQLPMFWVNAQPETKADHQNIIQTADQMRAYIEKNEIGMGLERCVYEQNQGMPCKSPIVRNYFCLGTEDLMRALDEVGNMSSARRPEVPMDRHIAAFLAARYRRISESQMEGIADREDHARQYMALLSLFATVQSKINLRSLPGLCNWMAYLLSDLIEQFHNRPLRKRLREELQKGVKEGDLFKLNRLIDNQDALKKDKQGFEQAREEYAQTRNEIQKLRQKLENRGELGSHAGHQLAGVVSSMLASAALALVIFIYIG